MTTGPASRASSAISARTSRRAPASDPQTLLTESAVALDVDVIANQTTPNTLATGGVAEFHLTDPVVALQGSGTADAPYVLLHLIRPASRP